MCEALSTRNRAQQLNRLPQWFVALLAPWLFATLALAQTEANTPPGNGQYSLIPRTVDPGLPPMVMLALSNDHQLFFKAYTDYDDTNGDGRLSMAEASYQTRHVYHGYFNARLCYSYNPTSGYFAADSAADEGSHYCNGTEGGNLWSGNFLNWASMTRIDVIRSILYGGKRSGNTDNGTLLERSYLPNDAHSFAKYYNGADLKRVTPFNVTSTDLKQQGLTLCNTTLHHQTGQADSRTNTNPPLMRAITGNYALWASGERYQCLQSGANETPTGAPANTGEAINNAGKADKLFAPLGFQPHYQMPNAGDRSTDTGELDYIVRVEACHKTLEEGSDRCKTYPDGSLKPTGLLQRYGETGQIEWGLMTGGYAKRKSGGVLRAGIDEFDSEVDPETGDFINNTGIITNLDALRISGWQWKEQGPYLPNCFWNQATFDNGQCVDWGNPFGEILMEAYRYFAGAKAPLYMDNGQNELAKGPAQSRVASWAPPVSATNYCANLNVLGLNTSAESYDFDPRGQELTVALGDIALPNQANRIENLIKKHIRIAAGEYFVGETDANGDQLCTPKTVNTDNLAKVAGLCPEAPRLEGSYGIAGIANEVSDIDTNPGVKGTQNITTYGVSLKTALPQITVDGITIIPACRNLSPNTNNSVIGNCALVDFRLLATNADSTEATYYVNWEDSEFGGDYDQDLHGLLTYSLTGNSITVSTELLGTSTAARMGFGYVITGVTNGGFKVHSGHNNYAAQGCTACKGTDPATSTTYTKNTAKVDFLQPPLFYAADNGSRYYASNNPAELSQNLESVLGNIGPKPARGGSEIAATDDAGDANLFLHTLYYPEKTAQTGTDKIRVTWAGQVGVLFLDRDNNLREDSNQNGRFDASDLIIVFDNTQKDADGQPVVIKHAEDKTPAEGAPATFADILYLWNTTDSLNAQQPQNRQLFSVLPQTATEQNDWNLVSGTLTPFTLANFGPNDEGSRYLGPGLTPDRLVPFIRGTENPELRNRTLNGKRHLLGDIQGPSPIILGKPDYSYDTEFGDRDYAAYKAAKATAPRVVITASNNGMIQAFLAGSYNADTKGYTVPAGQQLGQELWGYIPFNLLPHLQWLADRNYQRTPYFSGFMRTFDVKAFTGADANTNGHIGGWGTLLVVGTGQGGGHFPIDVDNKTLHTRPAYIVLDVSDRLNPPKLIAEISHEALGFTTAEPDVVRFEKGTDQSWFLVFGNGPRGTDLHNRRHAQLFYETLAGDLLGEGNANKAQLFAFNLKTKQLQQFPVAQSEVNAFVGGVNGMDWNRDFLDDAVYFGTISQRTTATGSEPIGRLVRGTLTLTGSELGVTFSTFFNPEKPIVGRPLTVIDHLGQFWVMAGTGRYFTRRDGDALHNGNVYVGLKEKRGTSTGFSLAGYTATANRLENISAIRVSTDGQLFDTEFKTINELRDHIATDEVDGWLRNLGTNERQYLNSDYGAQIVQFDTGIPGTQSACESDGSGYIYRVDLRSGVHSPNSGFTQKTPDPNNPDQFIDETIPGQHDNAPIAPTSLLKQFGSDPNGRPTKVPPPDIQAQAKRHAWRELEIPWQ